MKQKLLDRLQGRETSGNFRTLKNHDGLIDFVSNDYLGLGRNNELYDKISSIDLNNFVNKNGSTGSRLLAGNHTQTQAVEKDLAKLFNAESALIFNSGYAANLALISCVPQKGDTILYDSLAHVCLKEGAWLSKADSISFAHNDLTDLENKLKRAKGDAYIIIESVYSMDGDLAPIDEMVTLAKIYDADIIIDEAHGTGVFGDKGAGLVCALEQQENFLARVYTFGKAMGIHGACICGNQTLIDYLINFARPFIYTTALPMHSILSIKCSFEYLAENIELQKELEEKISFFNQRFEELFQHCELLEKPESHTAIQPVIIPGNEKITQIAVQLQAQGFDVRPILSPTVKTGTERLRISLHTHNTKDEIEDMLQALKRLI